MRSALFVVCCSCLTTAAWAGGSPTIYRCEVNGTLTFSDRPCGDSAEIHRSDAHVMNTYEAAPTAPTRPEPKTRSAPVKRARLAARVDPQRREQACERLKQSLSQIKSKMRAGYSAAEGERLKQRQSKLREQQRAQGCS